MKPVDRFNPPRAEQVRDYLQRHRPTGPARWTTTLPIVALGAVVALTFMTNDLLAVLLPAIVLAALLVGLSWRVRRLRDLEQRAARASELALTRHYPQALRLGWRLLPNLRAMPEMHGRTVAVMAYCLDQVKAHDAAIAAYDYLINHLPPSHPGSVQFTIERAINQLLSDQLADADDALRRLRGRMDEYAATPIGASFRLAQLVQQVQTNHFADAVEEQDDLVDKLRPLGIDAGYGYALMALSYHKLEKHGGEAGEHAAQVDTWWRRATLLLPAQVLAHRFGELAALGDREPTPRPAEATA